MASLQDKKREYYSKTQDVRNEADVPDHLESAGDVLIKDLARKQLNTRTTLEEQLMLSQEFEKGHDLQPWTGSGVTSLQELASANSKTEGSQCESKKISNLEEIKRRTGLSRHELELGLVEKPGSTSSVLYRFALGNRRLKNREDDLVSQLSRHPINRLKEIEKEFLESLVDHADKKPARTKRKRKKRLRKKKTKQETTETPGSAAVEMEKVDMEVDNASVMVPQPSLWDVKDMRKFCKNERQGCEKQNLYTIRDNQIVKLIPDSES